MTEPTSVPGGTGPASGGRTSSERTSGERTMLSTAMRDGMILVGALAVLGVVVGALVSGLPGVWGALLGAAFALFFSATTVWSMMRTVGSSAVTTGAFVMGSWLVKMLVLIVALAVLSRYDFYDRVVLFAVLLLGAVGSALLDYRAVRDARVPYVSPEE